jgi:hypothetical protein
MQALNCMSTAALLLSHLRSKKMTYFLMDMRGPQVLWLPGEPGSSSLECFHAYF